MTLRPTSRAIALMTLGAALVLAACGESPVDPSSLSPRVPKAADISMTAPVEGVVSELNGGPLEDVTITLKPVQ